MKIHMEAMCAATKFERWLDNRVQKLNKYNNAFYNNILDIMNEILANLDVYKQELEELMSTKMFFTEEDYQKALEETG